MYATACNATQRNATRCRWLIPCRDNTIDSGCDCHCVQSSFIDICLKSSYTVVDFICVQSSVSCTFIHSLLEFLYDYFSRHSPVPVCSVIYFNSQIFIHFIDSNPGKLMFIHSFFHSFIHSFVRSLIHSFTSRAVRSSLPRYLSSLRT